MLRIYTIFYITPQIVPFYARMPVARPIPPLSLEANGIIAMK
jgi:hypothetical protein